MFATVWNFYVHYLPSVFLKRRRLGWDMISCFLHPRFDYRRMPQFF